MPGLVVGPEDRGPVGADHAVVPDDRLDPRVGAGGVHVRRDHQRVVARAWEHGDEVADLVLRSPRSRGRRSALPAPCRCALRGRSDCRSPRARGTCAADDPDPPDQRASTGPLPDRPGTPPGRSPGAFSATLRLPPQLGTSYRCEDGQARRWRPFAVTPIQSPHGVHHLSGSGMTTEIEPTTTDEVVRPRARGWIHRISYLVAWPATLLLVAIAPTWPARLSVAVYGATLLTVFWVSSTYHRGSWTAEEFARWQRRDHAAIFL